MTVELLNDSAALQSLQKTMYHATIAHTPKLGEMEILPNAWVGVDSQGTIQFIESDTRKSWQEIAKSHLWDPSQVEVEDFCSSSKFVFPGFFDTHIHAPQFPNNGIFGDSTLLEWLEQYTFPLEARFKDIELAKEIYQKVIKRTLENGTTCASYYGTIHAGATNVLADCAYFKGQRALIGKCCMDKDSPDDYIESLEEWRKSQEEVISHINSIDPQNAVINPVLTPRFAGSCTEKLMKEIGELRKRKGYHCQTHLSENCNEIKWIMGQFPQYKNYTDIYDKMGLLSRKTILAHCVHLSEGEKDAIKKNESGISHCPISNSSLTSGEARVRWLLDNDINVSLGTDCSGGFSPSILEVARHALLVSRHLVMKSGNERDNLSTKDALYLATMGGASVLDLESQLGSFAVGKKWECQFIDLATEGSKVDLFEFQLPQWGLEDLEESHTKMSNLLEKWVFNGDDRNVRNVYVNGRCVVRK